MNQEWNTFLTLQGAQILDGVVQNFGNQPAELQAARDTTVLCDLSQFGTLRVAGEEAQKFLQNLLSSDINLLNGKVAQLSSFNSPKGRMLATFLIWQQSGDYLLQLPRSLTPAMHKKLSMFVLRSKVKVSDMSDETVCLGLSGIAAGSLIKQHFNVVLEQDFTVAQLKHGSIVRLSAHRYQINTDAAHAENDWSALAKAALPAGSACWDWLNIHAGIPVITPATQEQFVLQMSNLDLLGGVSFKKGCYPGQEIVARTHYLGKQKRRMFLAHVDTDNAPMAGNEVFSQETSAQACGMVMNACPAPSGGHDLLVVMQISNQESASVHLFSPDGPVLTFLPLPYSFPAA